MRVESIGERIKVRADFEGGRVTPLLFKRNGRRHRIGEVNLRWEDREGGRKLHYFSVTDDAGDVYQLHLDGADMEWRLDFVMLEGA
ncbi:MAG: hypothetical protein JW958_13890 [Candidatus Eisenbacteria bacterium]|nr:hypothetical protein [Candidatus Eisenbacteria bacterium]